MTVLQEVISRLRSISLNQSSAARIRCKFRSTQQLLGFLVTDREYLELMFDHFSDNIDHFNALIGSLLALDLELERSTFGLMQNIRTEKGRQVMRVHLVPWQLKITTIRT